LDNIRIVDLKKKKELLKQYIALRNKYTDLLLTKPVNLCDTQKWLKISEVEIKGLLKNKILVGVVILYLDRRGEVAVFSYKSNKGIGTLLLKTIEDAARSLNLDYIWAFVLKNNNIAKHVFEKCGFERESEEEKIFEGSIKSGFKYIKNLKN